MKKIYFIQKNVNNQAKNKLDEALHSAFNKWNHHIVNEDNLEMFDILFDDTVAIYKDSGGRCKPENYSRRLQGSVHDENRNFHIHISESCSYVLYPILGEISIQNHKQ